MSIFFLNWQRKVLIMSFATTLPGRIRQDKTGLSALKFAALLQQAGCPEMTESRLVRIETQRCDATPQEKKIIAELLGVKTFELLGRGTP
jgi:hypothetical protein